MSENVTFDEIDIATPRSVSVSSTSTELSATRLNKTRRTQIVVTPLTGGVTVYLVKAPAGAAAAVNTGIVLSANQTFVEADDAGFRSWQGAYQIVASGNGTVAVSEVFLR